MDDGRGLSKFDHIVRDHLNQVFLKRTPPQTTYTTIDPAFTPDPHGLNNFIC